MWSAVRYTFVRDQPLSRSHCQALSGPDVQVLVRTARQAIERVYASAASQYAISGGMDQLLQVLAALSDADLHTRTQAERQLSAAAAGPGFAPALVHTALQGDNVQESLRQMALVVLKKVGRSSVARACTARHCTSALSSPRPLPSPCCGPQYVKEHWDDSTTYFQPPICSDADKQETHRQLPLCLGSPSSKLRTAAAMAIAAIAKVDFPQRWPGMLEWMLKSLYEQQDANLGA